MVIVGFDNPDRQCQKQIIMLDQGVYLAPSAYEAGFVSCMHSNEDIQATIDAADKVLGEI